MKANQIFTGNIMKCTKYDEFEGSEYIGIQSIGSDCFSNNAELYKENTILIRFENGDYVDLESLNSILDYIRIKRGIKYGYDYCVKQLRMSTSPLFIGDLFVDKNTLKPYYCYNRDYVSLGKLKKLSGRK